MNGLRYCEILFTFDDGRPTEVWGTQGVGSCDPATWDRLDIDVVASDYAAAGAFKNGPRVFVVDSPVQTDPSAPPIGERGEVREFGGMPMQLLATIDERPGTAMAYREVTVQRTITWAFNPGTQIYELTDPTGASYVMQSYSQIVDPDLDTADLGSLGDRLDLPEGWSFSTRVLDVGLELRLGPVGAVVIQDDLGNTYQAQ